MTVRYGRYEVLYKLGQGAMAQVFLARDPVLSRFVAIKVLHAGLAARKDVLHRFFNEARTVAYIRNPHVVELFDFGQEGRDLYQVMEFVDGLSLHALLRRLAPPKPEVPGDAAGPGSPAYAPMDPVLAAALVCQAAEGLAIAARHGVVHRDLKPENLMINTQGHLKLSDFGIAHVQDESLTETGAVLGSPLYMSPEQALGRKPITAQSDMFSLGAVLYACLAGHPPFRARSVTELFRRIASEPHPALRDLGPALPPLLCDLTDTLLRKVPGERGGGAPWVHRQLKGFLRENGVEDAADPVAECLARLKAKGVRTTLGLAAAATLPMTAPGSAGPVAETGTAGARATIPFSGMGSAESPEASSPIGPRATGRESRSARFLVSAGTGLLLLCLGAGAGALGWKWLDGQREDKRDASQGSGHQAGTGVPRPDGASDGSRLSGPNAPADAPAGMGRVTGPEAYAGGVPAAVAGGPGPSAEGTAPVSSGESALTEGRMHPEKGGPRDAGDPVPINPKDDRAGTPVKGPGAGNILVLKSSPPFAEAYLDGRYVGVTPVRLSPVTPGRHRLQMKSARAPSLDTLLTVSPGIQSLKIFLGSSPALRIAAFPGEEE